MRAGLSRAIARVSTGEDNTTRQLAAENPSSLCAGVAAGVSIALGLTLLLKYLILGGESKTGVFGAFLILTTLVAIAALFERRGGQDSFDDEAMSPPPVLSPFSGV